MNGPVNKEPICIVLKRMLMKVAASSLFSSCGRKLLLFLASRYQVQTAKDGTVRFPFVKRRSEGNVQILVYHRVNDEYDPFFPAVPIQVFAQQMDYLVSNYHVCSLDEAVTRLKTRDVPDKVVVVTFDDGYRDNHAYAFPILKQCAIPATIFLATNSIGTGKILWHDRLFSAFRETKEMTLFDYHPEVAICRIRTLDEKLKAMWKVIRVLRRMNDVTRDEWLEHLVARLNVPKKCEDKTLMLSWDEVKAMAQHGILFGAHTANHPILSRLDPQRVREEIRASSQAIESNLGVAPKTFAYPNGLRDDFNGTTKALLQEAGFQCAVTSMFGTNDSHQDLFELRRGQPWEHHLPTFAAKLSWYRMVS